MTRRRGDLAGQTDVSFVVVHFEEATLPRSSTAFLCTAQFTDLLTRINVLTHNGYSNKGPPIIEVPIGVGAITCFTDNEIG